MRDWLSHLVLSELYERRQRGTITIEGCQDVREAVKTGQLPSAVTHLVTDSHADGERGTAWFENELRTALQAWEADGEISPERAAEIRDRLDGKAWADAAATLIAN